MKFRLVLDEPRDFDKFLEARGLKFALDTYAASFIESIIVDYDDYEESFVVINEAGPTSAC